MAADIAPSACRATRADPRHWAVSGAGGALCQRLSRAARRAGAVTLDGEQLRQAALDPRAPKKVYTAEQLARLMFIAAVKPVVPLEGLRLMFGIQEGSYALCTAYDYFCDEFENMLFAAFGVAPAAQGLGETRSAAKDLLRNTVSAIVNKIYLDRYLSDYQDRLAQEGSSLGGCSRRNGALVRREK